MGSAFLTLDVSLAATMILSDNINVFALTPMKPSQLTDMFWSYRLF